VGWDGRGGVIQIHASQADDQGCACAGCGFWLEAAQGGDGGGGGGGVASRPGHNFSEEFLNGKAVYKTNKRRGGAA
jgi:hypothetical protein